MVSSRIYPDLERKPGGPDNWVEAAGGLPDYIERIAKHLHYERGFTISRSIATAVNTVKRWAKGGTVTKSGTVMRVTPKTVALAAKAVAEWEAKKRAGSLGLSEELLAVIDLADADVDNTDGMVALMLPRDVADRIAVGGGVPAEDMHITLTFHRDVTPDKMKELVGQVRDAVLAWDGGSIKGSIGGLGHFEAKNPEKGTPYFAEVSIPALGKFQKLIADKTGYVSDYGKYNAHVTLSYVKEGEEPPAPVPNIPVEFHSVHVVVGNSNRVKVPLAGQTSADLAEPAILAPSNLSASRGQVDIQALADRANRVTDPEARATARQAVLDLATAEKRGSVISPRGGSRGTTRVDRRPSYKRQGKWGHGFVPLDKAAREAKAKGSRVALKRVRRIFKGKVKIDEKKNRGTESASSLGQLRNQRFQDAVHTENKDPKRQREVSKDPRTIDRAKQDWDSIPSALKTVRNGKRYVMAEFGGRNVITEWVGGVNESEQTALKKRKIMRSITAADAANMTNSELRAMLDNPQIPESVRKVLNKALRDKEKEANRG